MNQQKRKQLNLKVKFVTLMLSIIMVQGVDAMLTPKPFQLNDYSTQDIFSSVILPVTQKHGEALSYFADPKVWITEESANHQGNHGWTYYLSDLNPENTQPLLSLEKEVKYVELERTLSSIVAFALFYDGSNKAYQKFILGQQEPVLTYKSFKEIHELTKEVAPTPELYNAVIAMLIYSDLGKTPKARENAKALHIDKPDHDDWVDELLSRERSEISQVIPGFFESGKAVKDTIQRVASSMKVHFGHVLHVEGGTKMFSKLLEAMKKEQVTHQSLRFAFLIQICDVAASASHGSIESFKPFNNNTYLSYKMVEDSLNTLFKTRNPQEALNRYFNARADLLGFNPQDPKEHLMTRFACFTRTYESKKAAVLKRVTLSTFTEEDWDRLSAQFALTTGLNQWSRNPTYLTTVLLNLGCFQDPSKPLEEKYERMAKGALYLTGLLEHYSSIPGKTESDVPLCLNKLAGSAAKDPGSLLSGFDRTKLQFDERNNALLEPPKVKAAVTGLN